MGSSNEHREEARGVVQRRDLIGGLAFLVLGCAVVVEAVRLGVGTPGRPGPGFVPLVLGGLLILWSIALALSSLRMSGTPSASLARGESATRGSRVLYVAIALVTYAVLFEIIGYALSTFALLCLLFVGVWPGHKRRAVASALLAVVCTYILFVTLLNVRLPSGVLAGWG